MMVLGCDPHKRSVTCGAVEAATAVARGAKTAAAHEDGFDVLLRWARDLDRERVWAIEDCRHVSGRLERFLVARGERVVRVAPKLMAGARDGARTRGKSDAIDALAVARAAVREGIQTLPMAWLDERALELRLLVDHREDLLATRTRDQARLRWHLHDLDPTFRVPARALDRPVWWRRVQARLEQEPASVRVQIALALLEQIRAQTASIRTLETELDRRARDYAPRLVAERGCGPLTAAKLIGEIAGVERFATDAKLARNAGSAPIPACSGNRTRHRLDRGGNRQLNCALHRLAVNKGLWDPDSAAYLARRQADGKTRKEALRCLKRHLARRVWKLLQLSAPPAPSTPVADHPPVIATAGRMIHCNKPAGIPALT
jgi:transposase